MKLLTLIFCLLPVYLWGQPNNPGKNIVIYLVGDNEDHIFHAEQLITRFDKERGQFRFYLPFAGVSAQNAGDGTEMIENVLGAGDNLVFDLSLLLPESNNLEDLKDPESFTLDGLLEIAGDKQEVPVNITLMSSGNSLFYKLNFNAFLQNIPLAYRQVLTGKMVFVVKQSVWRDFFVNN